MRVLFVCTANVCRSRMAEDIFRQLVGDHHEVRSAGVRADPSGRQLSAADLEWADVVCVMEAQHRAWITARFGHVADRVRVFGIPDIYVPGDPVLSDVLTAHIRLLLADRARPTA
jgi:protein-tyrosine-phosphatase